MTERIIVEIHPVEVPGDKVNGTGRQRVGMITQPRCLQERAGSCGGCNILNIALDKSRGLNEVDGRNVIRRISRDLCPTGNVMHLPEDKVKSRW